MSLKILVPCKRLREGKSRLAPVLTGEERHALCRGFLEATLTLALALVPARDCLLVTGDAEAAALAQGRGIASLDDEGKGLNPALRLGRDRLCREDGSSLLVLPIDLPRAGPGILRELVATPADLAIAADRARQGTNVLYLGPKAVRLDFHFGIGSFAAHRRMAEEAGLTVGIFDNAALGFDIDQPQDLEEWRNT